MSEKLSWSAWHGCNVMRRRKWLGGAVALARAVNIAHCATIARAIAATSGLAKLAPGTVWVTVDKMTERALPTVMRKVIAHAVQA